MIIFVIFVLLLLLAINFAPYLFMNIEGIIALKTILPKIKEAEICCCSHDLYVYKIDNYRLNYWKKANSFSLKKGHRYIIISNAFEGYLGVKKLFSRVLKELESVSKNYRPLE